MDDARGVRGCQCVRNLDRIFQGFVQPQPLARDQLVERFARHELHGDEVEPIGLVDVVNRDDVRIV